MLGKYNQLVLQFFEDIYYELSLIYLDQYKSRHTLKLVFKFDENVKMTLGEFGDIVDDLIISKFRALQIKNVFWCRARVIDATKVAANVLYDRPILSTNDSTSLERNGEKVPALTFKVQLYRNLVSLMGGSQRQKSRVFTSIPLHVFSPKSKPSTGDLEAIKQLFLEPAQVEYVSWPLAELLAQYQTLISKGSEVFKTTFPEKIPVPPVEKIICYNSKENGSLEINLSTVTKDGFEKIVNQWPAPSGTALQEMIEDRVKTALAENPKKPQGEQTAVEVIYAQLAGPELGVV